LLPKVLYTDRSHALRGNDKSVDWKMKDAILFIIIFVYLSKINFFG